MWAELMVQFTLPKNSKITAGKTWTRPVGARNQREYRVSDDGKNSRMDTYFVDLHGCGPMVLDALILTPSNKYRQRKPQRPRLTKN
jgi:succinate dehydrogenase iron-sulfur subunit